MTYSSSENLYKEVTHLYTNKGVIEMNNFS